MCFEGRVGKIRAFLRGHRKSLVAQMILSYVVLQALCIFFFLVPATEATRVLRSQAREKAVDQALATSRQADSTFTFFRNAGVSMISEQSVSDLAHMMEKNVNDQYLSILTTLRGINSVYGSAFDQMYLYFKNQDALLGVAGKLDREALRETIPFNALTRAQYDALFSGQHRSPELMVAGDGMIYYCYTLPFRYMQDQSIDLVFSLSMHTLFTRSQAADIAEIYGMVLPDGAVHLSQSLSPEVVDEIARLAAQTDGGCGAYTLSTGQTLCAAASDFPGCSYLYVGSPDRYARAMGNYVRVLWLAMLFFVVLSAILIALFVAGQYRPIKALLSELDAPDAADLRYDEYRQIFTRLEQLREQHDRDRNVLSQHRTGLVHFLYRRLLSAEPVSQEEWSTFERLYGAEVLEGSFCVVAISAARGRSLPGDVTEHTLETHPLIGATLTGLLGDAYRIELLESHGLLCCVLNARGDVDREDLRATLETAGATFREKGHIYCDFYAGDFHPGARSLARSFREAMECVERNTSFGSGAVLFYADMRAANPQMQGFRGVYPIEMENKLLARLKASDEDGALGILDELFTRVYGSSCDSALTLHSLSQNLLCTFLRVLEGLPLGGEDALEERLSRCFVSDFRLYPEPDVRELFNELATDVMKRVRAEKSRGALRLYQEIVGYVADNLADPNLSVASIAEHFSYSVSALSGYFSSVGGDGLHNHINRMRVEAAIRLMKERPETTLEEISLASGFTNLRTFTRVFSAETGVTPGRYRKALHAGDFSE